MTISDEIKKLLLTKIRNKLTDYKPETSFMPFHYRLLGKDRMALYSFIHSINTILGQSIFEQVAVILATKKGMNAASQFTLEGYISNETVLLIDKIERDLISGEILPDKLAEIARIKEITKTDNKTKLLKQKVDVYITDDDNEYYFEIKTAKPNIQGFKAIKKQLLEWVALINSNGSPNKTIKTMVAIPYNPYEPKPYERWTLRGMFDLEQELVVGKEFWDLIGGNNTYEKLLDIFEQAGLELYDEIDYKMKNLK